MADKKLSEEEVADLKEAFAMFDINGDGKQTFVVLILHARMTTSRPCVSTCCCLWLLAGLGTVKSLCHRIANELQLLSCSGGNHMIRSVSLQTHSSFFDESFS